MYIYIHIDSSLGSSVRRASAQDLSSGIRVLVGLDGSTGLSGVV